jgi:hypothetical protein
MKRLMFILLVFFAALNLRAQTDTGRIYSEFPTPARFPGGIMAFENYAGTTIANQLKTNREYGVVVAEILVEKNGKVSKEKIIQGLSAETDSTVLYLLKNSPLWRPGHNAGHPVRTLIKVDVNFRDPASPPPSDLEPTQLAKELQGSIIIDEPVGYGAFDSDDPNHIYTSVEMVPEFPGGVDKLMKYIRGNKKVKASTIPIRVIITFIVEKDGSLTDIKVAKRFSAEYDADALRLMKQSPKWRPGMLHQVPVRTKYAIPIVF